MSKHLNYYRSHTRLALATGLFLLSRLLPPTFRLQHKGKTRVMVFHHLDEPERMKKILTVLQTHYHFLSFRDYLAGHKSKDRLNIIIACDDGYRSWYTHGLPLFRIFGIRPLLFINSDFVELTGVQAQEFARQNILTRPEEPLSWGQIHELKDAGAEIGGHTRDHANLITCADDHRRRTIGEDRAILTEKLGTDIRSFAYPFGLYNAACAAAVQSAGYVYGFTSESGFLEDSEGPYYLRRSNLGLRSAFTARAVAEGYADLVSELIRWVKTTGRRLCART